MKIKSNTRIYLDAGAVIKGSENSADYPTDEGRPESDHINRPKETYTDNGEWMTFSRLILIDNAENVQILGSGVIDGSGSVVRSQGKPANLIRIRRSKNILIDGVVLRDPAAWNTHIQMSEDVTIRNVKVINDFDVPNTHGFDPDASRNVLIDNCFAYCNDDNVAIKTTNNLNLNQDLDNITIKNCVFLTRKSALKVGTETKAANMTNIIFKNNDVVVCDRGIVLYCYDGANFSNIQFINNRFEYSYIKGQQRGVHFIIRDRSGRSSVSNVLVKDCINFYYRKFFWWIICSIS
ncbi:MAG: glycosyl hydrolase family 28 protein [Paludibacter sp.]|nr:glycosyl hydrolase family 28 protein [Paludibacter sp.]